MISPLCRWFTSRHGIDTENWDNHSTATHLRFDGLALGFWASYLPFMAGRWWLWLRQYSRWLFWAGWSLLVPLPFYSDLRFYRLGFTELALAITMILVHLTGRNPGSIVRSRAVHWIALTSYSVYLTHTLMIHVALEVLPTRVPSLPDAAFFPLSPSASFVGGALFYLAFETELAPAASQIRAPPHQLARGAASRSYGRESMADSGCLPSGRAGATGRIPSASIL